MAVSGPAAVSTVATTCPTPTPDAVNVVAGPAVGATVPGVPGATLHAADTDGSGFPNASRPTAVNVAVWPSGTVAAEGSTRSDTGAAPVTVTVSVPDTTPAPLAVSVAVPAAVSW